MACTEEWGGEWISVWDELEQAGQKGGWSREPPACTWGTEEEGFARLVLLQRSGPTQRANLTSFKRVGNLGINGEREER